MSGSGGGAANNDGVAGGSEKSTVRPRRKMSAFGYFTNICKDYHELSYPGDQVHAELSLKCFIRWPTMTDRESMWFHALAAADKRRFEREMANYIPPEARTKRTKRKLKKTDPNFPKRPTTAFFLFCKEKRPWIKMMMPGLKFDQIREQLDQMWTELSQEDKASYADKAKEDKIVFQSFLECLNRSSTAERAEDADDEDDEDNDLEDAEFDDEFDDGEGDDGFEGFSEDDIVTVPYERI